MQSHFFYFLQQTAWSHPTANSSSKTSCLLLLQCGTQGSSLLPSVPLLPNGGHSTPKFHVFLKDKLLRPPVWYLLSLNWETGILQRCFHPLKCSKVESDGHRHLSLQAAQLPILGHSGCISFFQNEKQRCPIIHSYNLYCSPVILNWAVVTAFVG